MNGAKVATLMAVLVMMLASGCGSGGSGDSTNTDNADNGDVVTGGSPAWIGGGWSMVRWGGDDVTRFVPTLTILGDGFSASFTNRGVECVSNGVIAMDINTPSWQTNEYSMTVSDTTCTLNWGPATLEGGFDQGSIFADDERFLIRVSSLFPDFWEYVRAP